MLVRLNVNRGISAGQTFIAMSTVFKCHQCTHATVCIYLWAIPRVSSRRPYPTVAHQNRGMKRVAYLVFSNMVMNDQAHSNIVTITLIKRAKAFLWWLKYKGGGCQELGTQTTPDSINFSRFISWKAYSTSSWNYTSCFDRLSQTMSLVWQMGEKAWRTRGRCSPHLEVLCSQWQGSN